MYKTKIFITTVDDRIPRCRAPSDRPRRSFAPPFRAPWLSSAAKGLRAALRRTLMPLLFVGFLAATASDSAADEVGDYDGLRFTIATGGDIPLLPVRFDGRDYLFVVDTGSTQTLFDENFREKLGYPLRTKLAGTTVGHMRTTTFRPPPATIAGRPLSGVVEVCCADLSLMRDCLGQEIYGFLGMDFLRDRRLRIDFDAGELTFLESVPDDPGQPIALSYSRLHGGVTAPVDVEGAGQQDFAIDTGWLGMGNVEVGLLARLLRLGSATALRDGKVGAVGSDLATCKRARLGDLALDHFRHRGLVFFSGTRSSLGTLYLSRYVVTFDFPAMKMYLKPGVRFNEPSLCDLSGLRLWRRSGPTTIHSIDDDSAAQRAGLTTGDVIDKIDSRAAASMSILDIYKLLSISGRHVLRVHRGDKTLEAVLVLEEPSVDSLDAEIKD